MCGNPRETKSKVSRISGTVEAGKKQRVRWVVASAGG